MIFLTKFPLPLSGFWPFPKVCHTPYPMAQKDTQIRLWWTMFFCSPEFWVFDSLLHFLLLSGMAIHYYQVVIKMTLSISDVRVISARNVTLEEQWGIQNRQNGLQTVHGLIERHSGWINTMCAGWNLCWVTQLLEIMYLIKMIDRE